MITCTSPGSPIIEFQNVSFAVPTADGIMRNVIQDISFVIKAGAITCLMGASGSGKTTLLRLMAGLVQPDSGRILVCGNDISRMKEREITDIRREMGFVFQYSALFDSMDVGHNIGFGLERRRRPRKEINAVVKDLLEEVGLEGIETKRPSQLSGGQKKRVAMARALATSPKIVLYDEPDSGLDPIMTKIIDDLIIKIRKTKQTTNIVVTHNVHSVWRIADRVLMLDHARIVADGTPAELQASKVPIVHEFFADNLYQRNPEMAPAG
jgi:phospholipid/cholesterol/gamma-HCH transport system ATP-binding protein